MVSNILQAKEGFNLLMSLCFSQIKKREKGFLSQVFERHITITS